MVLISGHEVLCAEEERLKEDRERTKYWKKWGTYLSERQWATVREDYSDNGDAWSHFPHEHARSRTFRWGEDGIAGVCDTHGQLNIGWSFWNEKDDFLKERLFGLSNPQGNHGESIKEVSFHLDNTPTHSYSKYLYKYPQKKFPYEKLVEENARRGREDHEYQILDTGVFDDDRYFDCIIESAKESEEELLFRVTAFNRGPEAAPLHIIPQVWFRNTWSWDKDEKTSKPSLRQKTRLSVQASHPELGQHYVLLSDSPGVTANDDDVLPQSLYTENDTNFELLYKTKNLQPYVKDAFHRRIVDDEQTATNPRQNGTKYGAWYAFDEGDGIPPGECAVVRFRLSRTHIEAIDEDVFDEVMERRQEEAEEFYQRISPLPMSDDLRNIQRQALSGMLWCKQYYNFVWDKWANGDKGQIPPPDSRKGIRNSQWKHMHADDILSMPDSWEYPFFAAWDTAFHCIPLAMIDPEFAKKQLDILTREWYMHPSGQLPAYEWNFSDVNPPVHAWAVFRVFKIERKMYGRSDLDFLERVFQKLLLNFTWWVNRKDADGKGVFEGGFLGLDNIGLFNRSEPLPTGGTLEQADSTGWMAFYCLSMLNIALELSKHRRIYEDIASKFFEHFILISEAMTHRLGEEQESLWDDEDGFYYDAISWGGPHRQKMPIRSLVGLIPLFAVLTLEPKLINQFPSFKRRMEWYIENRSDVASRNMASLKVRGKDDRILLSLVNEERLIKILKRMFDETEFLADHGIRSLSKYHSKHPYSMDVNSQTFTVKYIPGDSDSGLFGGNSNWRGPIWIAVNFLLIESLQRFFMFYGRKMTIECPTGSGNYMDLGQCAEEIQERLQGLFARDDYGRRAYNAGDDRLNLDPHWRECLYFHEFFDGDSGRGLGAQSQLGWTGLIGKIIHDTSASVRLPQTPKTPTAAASHYADSYFDETFDRSKRRFHLRRSSTTRSIGNPSTVEPSTAGGDGRSTFGGDGADDDDDDTRSEANRQVAEYVAEQLERVRSHESAPDFEDEIETRADEGA